MITNIGYVKDLKLEDLEKLYNFSKNLVEKDFDGDESTLKSIIKDRLLHFFPLNVDSIDDIMNIIETKSEEKFKEFMDKYGENKINKSGIHYDRIIEHEYVNAKEYCQQNGKDSTKNKVFKQIINAKELKDVKLKGIPRSIEDLKSMNTILTMKTSKDNLGIKIDIMLLYKTLLERFPDNSSDIREFLFTIFDFCRNKKKPEYYVTFLGLVLRRIELLNKDDDVESTSNGEFLESIKGVFNIQESEVINNVKK